MSIEAVELEPDPIEIDPPICEHCGCVIEDLEALIHLRAADLLTQWELADPRDAWRHTGDPAPPVHVRNAAIGARSTPAPRPYSPPQSVIDAFWCVVSLKNAATLEAWLRDHPLDAPELFKLWKAKRCS
jgi:hypothetical protein